MELNQYIQTKQMNLSDYVKIYDNVIPKDYCRSLIDLFEKDTAHQQKNDKESYNFTEINTIQAKWDLSVLFSALNEYRSRYFMDTGLTMYHIPKEIQYEEFRMKRYRPITERFLPHVDTWGGIKCTRFLVFFWYLNDVDEGGETELYGLDKPIKVQPKAGRMLWFPTTFQYLHAGLPPITNNKYIIGGYLRYDPKVRV